MAESQPLDERATRLRQEFADRFGTPPDGVARGPGRVNLIGEHTDYNDGFVLPLAIDRDVLVAFRRRSDGRVRVWSANLGAGSGFALDDIGPDPAQPWSNYVRGVAAMLRERGLMLAGMDALIRGTVPLGAGLSSSAAIEVASAHALLAAAGLQLSPVELALLCQRAENQFVGMRCGIMDQLIAALGQPGHALLIDCRDLNHRAVPLPAGIAVVICDSRKPRGLVSSAYNQRRAQCEEGVRLLSHHLPGVRALRDVGGEQFARFAPALPEMVRRRCSFVVGENQRVLETVEALEAGRLDRVGELMGASHEGLRDDYEVSCAELDALVEIARAQPGCHGARMTGAGFGGCTVNLVEVEAVPAFEWQVAREYARRVGREAAIYVCQASAGGGLVN